ncbi:MAG: DUF6286 domain-containing protein [Janthinobacterium lividum]
MSQDTSTRPAPMGAASQKSGSGAIGVVGPILSVLLLALGFVLLRDALVAAGAFDGKQWLPQFVSSLRGTSAKWWLIPAGIVVALIGIWLLVTSLRPRSRKTLALTSQTGVFLHTRDIARLASGAARDLDGVMDASTKASRRKVNVTVHALSTSDVTQSVTSAVTERLSALQSPPRVSVTVHTPREN